MRLCISLTSENMAPSPPFYCTLLWGKSGEGAFTLIFDSSHAYAPSSVLLMCMRSTITTTTTAFWISSSFAECVLQALLLPRGIEATCILSGDKGELSWELNSNESASWMLEMCITTWSENAISEVLNFTGGHAPDPPKRACFHTLTPRTLRSTVYVALPVPEQLPYSGYTTVSYSNLTI